MEIPPLRVGNEAGHGSVRRYPVFAGMVSVRPSGEPNIHPYLYLWVTPKQGDCLQKKIK